MSDVPEEQSLDFSTVIASTVHDMKNSLGLLMQSYGQLVERLPANEHDSTDEHPAEVDRLRAQRDAHSSAPLSPDPACGAE